MISSLSLFVSLSTRIMHLMMVLLNTNNKRKRFAFFVIMLCLLFKILKDIRRAITITMLFLHLILLHKRTIKYYTPA